MLFKNTFHPWCFAVWVCNNTQCTIQQFSRQPFLNWVYNFLPSLSFSPWQWPTRKPLLLWPLRTSPPKVNQLNFSLLFFYRIFRTITHTTETSTPVFLAQKETKVNRLLALPYNPHPHSCVTMCTTTKSSQMHARCCQHLFICFSDSKANLSDTGR